MLKVKELEIISKMIDKVGEDDREVLSNLIERENKYRNKWNETRRNDPRQNKLNQINNRIAYHRGKGNTEKLAYYESEKANLNK